MSELGRILEALEKGELGIQQAAAKVAEILQPRVRTHYDPNGTEYDTDFQQGTYDEIYLEYVSGRLSGEAYRAITNACDST